MPYGSVVVDNIIPTSNLSIAGNVAVDGNITSAQSIIPTQGKLYPLIATTAVATTSGTTVVITTAIPSWVTRITVVMYQVAVTSTSRPMIQMGYGATPTWQTASYINVADNYQTTAGPAATNSTGFTFGSVAGATAISGSFVFNLVPATNTWIGGATGFQATSTIFIGGGSVTLGGVLTSIRLISVNGQATFTSGQVCVFYE
jgi:hypothetical protein